MIVSPATAVPLMCGWPSLVVLPAGIGVTAVVGQHGAAGVAGVVVSILMTIGVDGVLGVPAAFVSITVMLCCSKVRRSACTPLAVRTHGGRTDHRAVVVHRDFVARSARAADMRMAVAGRRRHRRYRSSVSTGAAGAAGTFVSIITLA